MPRESDLPAFGESNLTRKRKIPHTKILLSLQNATSDSGNIVELYRLEVIPVKTRTIRLLGKKTSATVRNTLLGFEVQASYKRILCPDMPTARYLKSFTELGCHSIRLPYDPTLTARLVPEIESGLAHISAGVHALFPNDREIERYVLRRIYEIIRKELKKGEGLTAHAAFTSPEGDLS